jgi:hypothetical protein
MVSMTVQLALDGFIATPLGPVLVPELTVGSPVFVIAGGVATEASVSGLGGVTEKDVFKFLTAVGDIVVPGDETVITRSGPLQASAVAKQVLHGGQPRLEVMNPAALPTKRSSQPRNRAIQAFLRSLHPAVLQLPRPVAQGGLADELESILRDVGVRCTRIEDERWTTFAVDNIPSEVSEYDVIGVAQILLMLTAWEREGEAVISRTRLEASQARRRLIVSLVAELTPYEVRWVPGYRPVECRIHSNQDGRWPPFVPVLAALPSRCGTVRLTTTEPGGIVVGLALTGPIA